MVGPDGLGRAARQGPVAGSATEKAFELLDVALGQIQITFGGVGVAAGERGVGFAQRVVDSLLGGGHAGAQGEACGLLLARQVLQAAADGTGSGAEKNDPLAELCQGA